MSIWIKNERTKTKSATCSALLFDAIAIDPRSQARLVAQHHLRCRRLADALRQVAQRPGGSRAGAFTSHWTQHPRFGRHTRVGQLHLRRFQQVGPSGEHDVCPRRRYTHTHTHIHIGYSTALVVIYDWLKITHYPPLLSPLCSAHSVLSQLQIERYWIVWK